MNKPIRNINNKAKEFSIEDFQRVFDEFYYNIKNFIYYKSGDTELSEDIAQDTFMILWETRDKLKKRTVKAYLYTIANNLFINQAKRNKVVFNFINSLTRQTENSPEYELEVKEFDAKLQAAIASIPEKSRIVFLMNRIDGFTYNEIADRLDLSVKAVEKRMHKALEIIKTTLGRKI